MLTLILGKDWRANTDYILSEIAKDVASKKENIILLVPELISHDMERRLCQAAGDTVSRYAEVLSFPRLLRRVADSLSICLPECMDEGGRIVAMAAATHQLHSRLKAYAALETRPEFLSGMVDAVDEFKRCCICADDLSFAAAKAEGSLAQKLEELGLIYSVYEGICAGGKRDPRDQMNWLLEQLEDCDFAQKHTLYIDGFPDFTRQHMNIIAHFIANCPNVVISLNCDTPGSVKSAYKKAGETAAAIIRAAKDAGVACNIQLMPEPEDSLLTVAQRLFQGSTVPVDTKGRYKLLKADSAYDECIYAAGEIRRLVSSGARYRDIGVVCCNMSSYQMHLDRIFSRLNIPIYLSGTEDILNKSVVHTVIAALEAAASDLRQKDVLAYLKSALSPLSLQDCDIIENYVLTWKLSGRAWTQPWTMHPEGLSAAWREKDRALLERLNELRSFAIDPLHKLCNLLHKAVNLSDQIAALTEFLNETQLASRLSALANTLESVGDNRSAQIMQQLWDILLNAIDQMQDLLSETVWDSDAFLRLFKLLLSQYTVGTIPSVLDTVTIGSVSAMRCQRVKHLLVLGALEGSMPSYAAVGGILSEQERNDLRKLDLPLTGGALDGLSVAFSEIYGVFTAATDTVCVSCPSGQPSFAFQRLEKMVGQAQTISAPGMPFMDTADIAPYLAYRGMEDVAVNLNLQQQYRKALQTMDHTLGNLNSNTARALYGDTIRMSATNIDTYGRCQLAYFMRYGLRLKPRKVAEVDPAEFGSFVHKVLETLGRQVDSLGGFRNVTLEKTLELSKAIAGEYIAEHFGAIDSQRTSYLLNRNEKQLQFIVTDLWEEMQTSLFQPGCYELSFGEGKILDAIEISGKDLKARLEGYVDRVDLWENDGKVYFRVIDYKTGKTAFDYCDVFNGIGLQMLLYLFALEQKGESLLGGNPVPAGVLYFPASADFISADGSMDVSTADAERLKLQKRTGLVRDEYDVIVAMQPEDAPNKLPLSKTKDGELKGDLVSAEQIKILKRYITMILERMADRIASGAIAANPYVRGSKFDSCQICNYRQICSGKSWTEPRNYKSNTREEFWSFIGRELEEHGR